ncbi:GFA family protein [Rhodanobacter ginsengisoli]|uniref:GFA family protein n=1 Tax=Rhodanobacter ginsengisoli TaxID=418646 RepID=A0ABW0QU64_9GAMM
MPNDRTGYTGTCHCGAVKFVVNGPITRATQCTCSVCSRMGALWHGTDESGLTVLSGEDQLRLYQFGSMTAKHYFCRNCGIHPFSRPRLNPKLWVVNLRCVPDIDAASLPVSVFDGAHWEEAAQALLSRARPGNG